MTRIVDVDLDMHLARWGGATTAAMLHRDGVARRDVERALADKTLLRVRRGTFIQPAEHEEARARAAVAVARNHPGCVLSHTSAIAAWGIAVRGPWGGEVELMDAGATRPETRPGALRVRPLEGVAAPLPLWPDVSAVRLPESICHVALTGVLDGLVPADHALHVGAVSGPDLVDAAARWAGRRAGHRAVDVVAMADARAESPGETELRFRLREWGIVTDSQVAFHDERGFVGRVDLYERRNRTAYEFDGIVKYAGCDGRDALVREKRREDRLRALGLRVVRVTWADLCPERLAALVHPSWGRAA